MAISLESRRANTAINMMEFILLSFAVVLVVFSSAIATASKPTPVTQPKSDARKDSGSQGHRIRIGSNTLMLDGRPADAAELAEVTGTVTLEMDPNVTAFEIGKVRYALRKADRIQITLGGK